MENLVTEYGNALIALVSGAIMLVWGIKKYVSHSKWLTNSKKTRAIVLDIERVIVNGEDVDQEYDKPTFEYQTTGEVKVVKSHQLFEKDILRVGDIRPVRYNHDTPGRVHSELGEDIHLLWAFLIAFLGGGGLLFISLIMFLA